ncbi:MIIP protein, partial [Amia calva]|nr:MIIP protein [Amia calva]
MRLREAMSSFDQLEALRIQNKDLLRLLRQGGQRLQGLRSGTGQVCTVKACVSTTTTQAASVSTARPSRITWPELGGPSETVAAARSSGSWEQVEGDAGSQGTRGPTEQGSPAGSLVTFTGECLGRARAALRGTGAREGETPLSRSRTDAVLAGRAEAQTRDSVGALGQTVGVHEGIRGMSTPEHKRATQQLGLEPPIYSERLLDQGNHRPRQTVQSSATRPKPILLTPHRERERARFISLYMQKDAGHVMFRSPDEEYTLSAGGLSQQPLMGYDWIAGMLDTDSSLAERSEQFFTEIKSFRQVNRDECVHEPYAQVEDLDFSPTRMSRKEQELEFEQDSHQCTYCYRVNSRLFPVPLDPRAACPVCRTPRSQRPHAPSEPAFIRVSIPLSTLLPAYRYKAHRRRSFGPSDSLGLPSHCLSGLSSTTTPAAPRVSSLDLRSSLETEVSTGPPTADQELSVSRVAGSRRSDDLLNVSRLARYHFQLLDQRRGFTQDKPHSTAYPVY